MSSFHREFWRTAVAPSDHANRQPGHWVHRNTGTRGLIEALRGHYPAVAAYLREADFAATAHRFCRSFPPSDSRLFLYGSSFPEYLAAIAAPEPLCAYARVDRAVNAAHVAADEVPLTLQTLLAERGDAAASAKLSMTKASELVLGPSADAAHDFVASWGQLSGRSINLTEHAGTGAGAVLVTRPDDSVQVTAIDKAAAVLVRCIRRGLSLHAASVKTLTVHPGVDLQSLLAALFGAGAFVYRPEN